MQGHIHSIAKMCDKKREDNEAIGHRTQMMSRKRAEKKSRRERETNRIRDGHRGERKWHSLWKNGDDPPKPTSDLSQSALPLLPEEHSKKKKKKKKRPWSHLPQTHRGKGGRRTQDESDESDDESDGDGDGDGDGDEFDDEEE